jgi:hypothetical protein
MSKNRRLPRSEENDRGGILVKTAISLGLALALLFVFAHPAVSHQLETTDPEPDYVLYGVARILYPLGDILNHLLFGPHEKEDSISEAGEEQEPKKPKYNFSPRKKHPQEREEGNP